MWCLCLHTAHKSDFLKRCWQLKNQKKSAAVKKGAHNLLLNDTGNKSKRQIELVRKRRSPCVEEKCEASTEQCSTWHSGSRGSWCANVGVLLCKQRHMSLVFCTGFLSSMFCHGICYSKNSGHLPGAAHLCKLKLWWHECMSVTFKRRGGQMWSMSECLFTKWGNETACISNNSFFKHCLSHVSAKTEEVTNVVGKHLIVAIGQHSMHHICWMLVAPNVSKMSEDLVTKISSIQFIVSKGSHVTWLAWCDSTVWSQEWNSEMPGTVVICPNWLEKVQFVQFENKMETLVSILHFFWSWCRWVSCQNKMFVCCFADGYWAFLASESMISGMQCLPNVKENVWDVVSVRWHMLGRKSVTEQMSVLTHVCSCCNASLICECLLFLCLWISFFGQSVWPLKQWRVHSTILQLCASKHGCTKTWESMLQKS